MEPHREGNKDIFQAELLWELSLDLGELISYGFRLLSGYIGYRTKCWDVS